jgi:para-aminobenzoate synthetase/4-amino-4-deoxychorismate lyase
LEIDGAWLTPTLYSGLLPGVMRAELMARGEIVERVLMVDDLARAQSIWFINSVRGWIRVELIMEKK